MNTKEINLPFEKESDKIDCVSFDENGKYIAVACYNQFYIYSLENTEEPVLKIRSGDLNASFSYPLEFDAIDPIAFSQDSKIIAVSGGVKNSNEDFILFYSLEKFECIFMDCMRGFFHFRNNIFIETYCIYENYNSKNLIIFDTQYFARRRLFNDLDFKETLWEDDKPDVDKIDENSFDFYVTLFSQGCCLVEKYYYDINGEEIEIVYSVYEFSLDGNYNKLAEIENLEEKFPEKINTWAILDNSRLIGFGNNNESNQDEYIVFEWYNNQHKQLDKFTNSNPIEPIYLSYNSIPFWVVDNKLKYYVNNSEESLYLGDISENHHSVHINSLGNLIALIGSKSIQIIEEKLNTKKDTPKLFQPLNKRINWTEDHYEQLCNYIDELLTERLKRYINLFNVDEKQITDGLDELKHKLKKGEDPDYNSPGVAVAYALQYLPRKIIIATGVLEYYFSDYNIPVPRNVLDIGSGNDPVSIALGLCFPDDKVKIKAIEPSKAMRDLGKMCSSDFSNLEVLNVAGSIGGCWLEHLNSNYYDLIMMSSVLQKSFKDQENQWNFLAEYLYQSSTKEAKLISIEPITQKKNILVKKMKQAMLNYGWNLEQQLSMRQLFPEISVKCKHLEKLTNLQNELIGNYRGYPVETWNNNSSYNERIHIYSKGSEVNSSD
ncbi:hypothetical protein PCC7418_0012 [Halothece sp. PCC 7418]|uniref:small ribosomal subunit Rsm22 family protein n=1 Tax=Halothece sp. (strain PCC 7418) TaxID=65093 RepID=UPI0002A07ACB|nr:small ribosomal subunit Rsm22 family protein [Halothece sp. PCC 7418]AFZ42270.1 hypothetical protein PCC7418_0012 [Halothece sp. PCC 7418]